MVDAKQTGGVPAWLRPDELLRRRRELLDELTVIDRVIADLGRLGVLLSDEGAAPPSVRARGEFCDVSTIDAVSKILERAEGGLHLKEIEAQLAAGGKRLGGKKPYATLQSTIRGYPETFVNLGGNRWDLTKRHSASSATGTGVTEESSTAKASLVDAAVDVLLEADREMHVSEICRLMTDGGWETASDDPSNVIRTVLDREHRAPKGRVQRVAPSTYKLRYVSHVADGRETGDVSVAAGTDS